ncbi:head maturation protease, ClpP-related [Rhizobium miluonense]|uniref:ATP-dependent Clp protease proteolytic subunit n=1 Tax=Rhizobium miluonense TaxID=411945 RepID=A0A1C3WNY4_9HYPH|nr:head maturation protease, ClpP-related [Rhizobium miluonense]SCB41802.1 ATP-dependent Clp endopeptidase, proteolytic subunit ClpP [Rhizobium miluonense]
MTRFKRVKALAPSPAEICLFSGIGADETGEGITAQWFDAEFKALGNPAEVLVRINSPGGDVFTAEAIFTILSMSQAQITARIEGLAASAATLIAMAADRVEIASNGFMLIHEPYSAGAGGTADELRIASEDLQRLTDRYVEAYAKKTGQSEEDVLALMKENRLLSAQEAVEFGLCDEVIDPSQASINLKLVPQHLRAAVETAMHKGIAMAVTPKKNKTESAIAALSAKLDALAAIVAKAEDDGYAEDGDENDDKPSDARKARKARKARAEDDNDLSAEDDDDMNADVDDDDKRADADEDDKEDDDEPTARKARAAVKGLSYARRVADLCALAGRDDLTAGFLTKAVPVADVRRRLLKARSEKEGSTSNARGAVVRTKQEDVAKGWDAAVAKLGKR